MFIYDDIKSETSKKYYRIIERLSPELLQYAEVVSQDIENPYIEEEGTIILRIPTNENYPIKGIYVEARKDDVLIGFGKITHFHFSWDQYIELMEKRMENSVIFIRNVISGEEVLLKRRWFLFGSYYDFVDAKEINKLSGIIEIYRWG